MKEELEKLRQELIELGWAIEKMPASPEATALVVKCGEARAHVEQLITACDAREEDERLESLNEQPDQP